VTNIIIIIIRNLYSAIMPSGGYICIITNVLLILTAKCFKIGQYLIKLRHTKQSVPVFWSTLYIAQSLIDARLCDAFCLTNSYHNTRRRINVCCFRTNA